MKSLPCLECGNTPELVTGKTIYPHRPDLYEMDFWRCRCGAYVGCHKGTLNALGRPAGPATRAARQKAHAAFDRLWQSKVAKEGISKNKARGAGYRWLADQIGMLRKDCHISHMTAKQALQVVEICKPYHRK